MALRAWRNTLLRFGAFGNVPISLAPAKRDKPATERHHYDPATMTRAKQGYTIDGATVLPATTLAYDVDGEAVVLDPAPTVEADKGVSLSAYVAESAIDPMLYDACYVVWAGKGGDAGLAAIVAMLRAAPDMMLAGEAVFTDRPRSIVLRWSDACGALLLHTLSFTSRVDFAGMATASYDDATPAATAQAIALVSALDDAYTPADVDALEAATATALAMACPTATGVQVTPSTPGDILESLRADIANRSEVTKTKRKRKPAATASTKGDDK